MRIIGKSSPLNISIHKKVNTPNKRSFFCCNDWQLLNRWGFYPNFQYKLTTYQFARQNNRVVLMHPYKGMNGTLIDWYMELFDNKKIVNSFFKKKSSCYRGFFSTTRMAIQKHPLYVYEAIHAQQQYTGEEIDHYMERTWKALLETPYSITCRWNKWVRGDDWCKYWTKKQM